MPRRSRSLHVRRLARAAVLLGLALGAFALGLVARAEEDAPAPAPAPVSSVSSLDWLAGSWRQEEGQEVWEECWLVPRAGSASAA